MQRVTGGGGPTGAPGESGGGSPTVAGYRLLRRLGSGPSADRYLAASDAAGRTPTLVVLHWYRRGADPREVGDFVDAMSSVPEALLPRLLDIATLDDARSCLVVERFEGIGLVELLGRRRLEPGEAVTILAPIVAAVAALEARGFAVPGLTVGDVRFDADGRPRLTGMPDARPLAPESPIAERRELRRAGWTAVAQIIATVLSATRGGHAATVAAPLAEAVARPQFAAPVAEIELALFSWARPLPVTGVVPDRNGPGATAGEAGSGHPAGRPAGRPEVAAAGGVGALGAGAGPVHPGEAASWAPGRALGGPPQRGYPMAEGRPGMGAWTGIDASATSAGEGAGIPSRRSLRRDRQSTRAAARGSDDVWERLAAAADRGVPLARLRFALERRRRPLIVGALVATAVAVVACTALPAPHSAADERPRPAASGADREGGAGESAAGTARDGAAEGARDSGALPAGDAGSGATERTTGAGDGAGPSASVDAAVADGGAGAAVAGSDPVAAARILLAERSRCRGELSTNCIDGIAQPGSPLAASELALITAARDGGAPIDDPPIDQAGIEVIGSMGDAILLRVPSAVPETAPASLLIVRGEAGWRLREWFG